MYYGPKIVTSGLVLALDAANKNSYSGTGTTWYDLSGNNYNFTINASAYAVSNGIPHMNFEGTYGMAKRFVGGALADVPNFAKATFIVFSSILNSTADYRTLTRGAVTDHQIITNTGTNNLGCWDNTGTFMGNGFNITSLPNVYTQFNFLCFKLAQSSPYQQFQYNANPTIYTITNANATFDNGICSIGGFHNYVTANVTGTQYWGKISSVLYYNRHLSSDEISQNFNATRARFGL